MEKPKTLAKDRRTKRYDQFSVLAELFVEEAGCKTPRLMQLVHNWMASLWMYGSLKNAEVSRRVIRSIQYDLETAYAMPLEELPPHINDNNLVGKIARARLQGTKM